MSFGDFHVHTCFSDGKNTPEEVVLAAIEMGMPRLGISDHSGITVTSRKEIDISYCMPWERYDDYKAELFRLKDKYAGKIKLLVGIEQDYYGGKAPDWCEYVVGSLHYVEKDGVYYSVDHSPENFEMLLKAFDGDAYEMAEKYFETVSDVVEVTGADIIGHFDLVSKFNEGGKFFDESHPRYVAAWQGAADKLLKTGKPFEINTGAISRGYRTTPYPSFDMMRYITDRGGKLMLDSDSHSTSTVCYQFDKWYKTLKDMGIQLIEWDK